MKTRFLVFGVLLLLVQACSDSTSPPVPATIVVTPSSATLQGLGETQQFSARVEDESGREIPNAVVTWSSSDMTVATVTSAGLATGVRGGFVSIRAIMEGLYGEADLMVSPVGACDPTVLSLAPGESLSMATAGVVGCGFVLPAGSSGDRYRLAVLYASPEADSTDVPTVTVTMTEEAAAALAPGAMLAPSPGTPPAAPWSFAAPQETAILEPTLLEAVGVADATEALHHRIRQAERELVRSLGPEARPLPDTRRFGLLAAPSAPSPSPDRRVFTHPEDFSKCAVGSTVTAFKIAENDHLAIYQDSTQNASNALSVDHAQMLLDYYRDYGKQVIDQYFDGVSDINNDGRVVVLVSPVVEAGTAAFVWSGDFFPKTPQGRWPGCAASNEMELVRFSLSTIQGISSGNFQALATLVHEVKHVSSLYKGLIRGSQHPYWVEEGRAEIAGEMSSRLAWEATGGPAVNQTAVAANVGSITKENYGVILRMARTTQYLSSQPNAVVVTPTGAASGHTIYGSGWHFHRWLGDAYGTRSARFGDAPLFRTLNDSLSFAGVSGIRAVTGGKPWVDLMEEYALAVMQSGTPAPLGSRSFITYNFPSMNRTFTYTGKPAGDYPWPVNVSGGSVTAPFGASVNTGPVGPSGIRVLDLTSIGAGGGLKVRVDAPRNPVRVVVLRIQ